MRSLFALVALCPLAAASIYPIGGLLPKKIDMEDYKDRMEAVDKEAANERIEFSPFLRAGSPVDDRTLLESCDTDEHDICTAAAFVYMLGDGDSDVGIYSGCGPLFNENDGAFCNHSEQGKVCCGETSHCCAINGGALAGVIIAGVVLLTLSILGCCFCCSCCCLYEKFRGNTNSSNKDGSNAPPEQAYPKAEATLDG